MERESKLRPRRVLRKKAWDNNITSTLEQTRLSPQQLEEKAKIKAKYNAAIHECSPQKLKMSSSPPIRRVTGQTAQGDGGAQVEMKTPQAQTRLESTQLFTTPSPSFQAIEGRETSTMKTPLDASDSDSDSAVTPVNASAKGRLRENSEASNASFLSVCNATPTTEAHIPSRASIGVDTSLLKPEIDFQAELAKFRKLAKNTRSELGLENFSPKEKRVDTRPANPAKRTDSNYGLVSANSPWLASQLSNLTFVPQYLVEDFESLSVCCDNLQSYLTAKASSVASKIGTEPLSSPAIRRVNSSGPSGGEITTAERVHSACKGAESVLYLLAQNTFELYKELDSLKRQNGETNLLLKQQVSHTQQLERVVQNQSDSISDLLKVLKKQQVESSAKYEKLAAKVLSQESILNKLGYDADKKFAKWIDADSIPAKSLQ